MSDDQQQPEVYTGRINEDGHEEFFIKMGPAGGPEAHCYISPRQAIPIVFVPGIMGSPLIATAKDSPVSEMGYKWAWFPDNVLWMTGRPPLLNIAVAAATSNPVPLFMSKWTGFASLSAKQKGKALRVERTRVPTPEEADLRALPTDGLRIGFKEAARRGWGSVLLGSNGYGKILNYLDNTLNGIYNAEHMTPRWKEVTRNITDIIHACDTQDVISHEEPSAPQFDITDVEHLGKWSYPVYACGYNWLDSNDNSAAMLGKKIDEVLSDCRDRLGLDCEKVILVTHSMGGLVGRMCAKKYSDKIMGVVHGVQPVNGAAAAYHRVVAGWDGAAGMVLGEHAEDLTPIFSNPGPLQLLPNKQYGQHWFKVNKVASKYNRTSLEPILSLPQSNPYQEIYSNITAWWRIVDPNMVMPEVSSERAGKTFYQDNLALAEAFHDEIANYFHPETYVHYGKSSAYKTWYGIDINVTVGAYNHIGQYDYTDQDILNGSLSGHYTYWFNDAHLSINNGRGGTAKLGLFNDAGDGTVPASSMGLKGAGKVQAITEIDNVEHSGSYNHGVSRLMTLYGICNIVKKGAVDAG